MKTARLNYKKNPGLSLVILGLVIWMLPFILVAIDNLIGSKPADSAINNGGVFLIIVGPLLFLIGLVLIAAKFVLTLLNRK